MKFFEGLSEAILQKDENGNWVFYKWGILGRGVMIDTKERKDRILSFIATYYTVTFIIIFVMNLSIFLLHTDIFQTSVFFVGVGFLMMVWYLKTTADLTYGLEFSATRLTMDNAWKKTAEKLPKYILYGGFMMMIFLVLLSIGSLIYLDSSVAWVGAFLLTIGIFGIYAYYRMIQHAKNFVPTEPLQTVQTIPANEPASESIQFNAKNISIITVLLITVIGLVYLVYADSKNGFDKRMAMYKQMSTIEMAEYLAGLNAEPEQIDPITKHAGAKAEDKTIVIYRELKTGLLSDLVVDVKEIDDEKSKMARQLKREICGSPTYGLFFDKDGELLYVYHKVSDQTQHFLFDVKIDKAFCHD